MNTLSSLPPLSLASLGGLASLSPSGALSGVNAGTGGLSAAAAGAGAAGPAGAARQLAAWLDQGPHGQSEPLHVGPNSRPRAIDDIEHDFVRALCQPDPDKPM